MTIIDTKICIKCKQEKPLSRYNKVSSNNSNLRARCKDCCNLRAKEHHKKHPRKVNWKQHYGRSRAWLRRNPEWRKEYDKRPEVRKKIKATRKNCPSYKSGSYVHKRRARLSGTIGCYTASEWEALKEKYNYICLCCKEKKKLTIDHVIPLVKGGSNYISNIQPLCRSCNAKKQAKETDYRPKEEITNDTCSI